MIHPVVPQEGDSVETGLFTEGNQDAKLLFDPFVSRYRAGVTGRGGLPRPLPLGTIPTEGHWVLTC